MSLSRKLVLSLAAAWSDRICVLAQGRLRAQGAPHEVLRADLLGEVYEHPVDVIEHNGRLLVVPVRGTAAPGGAGVRAANAITALVMVAPPALRMFVPGAKAAEAVMAGQEPASDGLDLAWQLDAVRTYDPQPRLDAVTARVDRFLATQKRGRTGAVVLDPPRAGAGRQVVEAIHALAPDAIAYVACEPVALARDLGTFRTLGWNVDRLRGFDLFPHSHHFEVVALLTR